MGPKNAPSGDKNHNIFHPDIIIYDIFFMILTWGCVPNIARIIKNINSKIVCHNSVTSDAKECSCRDENTCPLQKKKSVVYEATLTTDTQKITYLGLTEGTFKERYTMHQSSSRHERYKHSTALSRKVWLLITTSISGE